MIDVLFLPKHISHGKVCVVVDVLRATSTIVTALAKGAKYVMPVASVAQAKRTKGKDILICGERNGIKPKGFHLGNSPQEYFDVKGKEIVLTTTNGTKAISMIHSQNLYASCFLNLHATVDLLKDHEHVTVVCSGQEGKVAYEDVLCAGAIVYELDRKDLTDGAKIAKQLWKQAKNMELSALLSESQHAQELIEHNFLSDIEFCAQLDLYNIVPFFSQNRFVIA